MIKYDTKLGIFIWKRISNFEDFLSLIHFRVFLLFNYFQLWGISFSEHSEMDHFSQWVFYFWFLNSYQCCFVLLSLVMENFSSVVLLHLEGFKYLFFNRILSECSFLNDNGDQRWSRAARDLRYLEAANLPLSVCGYAISVWPTWNKLQW